MSIAAFIDEQRERPLVVWPDVFPERLSPSSVALAVSCPDKWRRRYLLNESERWGGAALVGIAVHHAVEHTYRAKLETGVLLTSGAIKDVTAQGFEEKQEELEDIDWHDVKPGDAKDQAVSLSVAYNVTAAPTVEPVAVEEWVTAQIPGLPEIRGRVDVRTTTGTLDVKTVGRKVTTPQGDWRLKALMYQRMNGQPFSWHVLTKTKVPAIYTPAEEPGLHLPFVAAGFIDRRVTGIAQLLTDLYGRYGPDETWPSSAPEHVYACNFCSFRPTCGHWEWER